MATPTGIVDYSKLQKREPNWWMLVPVILLAALAAFTLWPQPLTDLVKRVADALM